MPRIFDNIERNDCHCIMLSATPYNKAYLDLGNQLRLFLKPDEPLGIRPEDYIRRDCDNRTEEFTRKHQCPVNCLAAFEKSEHADDWRELMRLFMVRRTRSFTQSEPWGSRRQKREGGFAAESNVDSAEKPRRRIAPPRG